MLRTLRVKNLAIIDLAELELDGGFVCLTGESGAGKSVLIDALLLLAGTRASSDLVRSGCDKAVVEASFTLPEQSPEHELLEGDELFLRREVTAEGRSRALVNGVMVPNSVLGSYAELAFEIHGQHGQQRLLRQTDHLGIFDEQVALSDQSQAFRARLEELRTDFRAWWEQKDGEARRLKEIDFLKLQIAEIAEVGPREEDADLELRLKAARNGETIRAARADLATLLNGDLMPGLTRLTRLLDTLREYDPSLDAYREQVDGASATLGDLFAEVSYRDDEYDAAALRAMEERENALNRLYMKYGRNLEEVMAEHATLKRRLAALQGASSGLEEGRRALEARYAELLEAGRALQAAREKAAIPFARKVEKKLRSLAMPGARFAVHCHAPAWPARLTEDRVLALPAPELSFQLAANAGEPLRPLARVASGGELSRVLLALISAFQRDSGRLLVFDEIDAGLGGETAHKVGRELADLGRRHQVLCVTHFAQVARFADHLIKIEKKVRGGRTTTSLVSCDTEQRVDELTRLLGGDEASPDLRQHARKLLAAQGSGQGG